ncbi:hypothetical protein AB5R29_001813 [Enterobacter hormaechei]
MLGNWISGTKKPPFGGFTTLLIALIILLFPMVAGVGLEPTQRERRGILNWLLKSVESMPYKIFPNIDKNITTLNTCTYNLSGPIFGMISE